jgi:hypothetical protein
MDTGKILSMIEKIRGMLDELESACEGESDMAEESEVPEEDMGADGEEQRSVNSSMGGEKGPKGKPAAIILALKKKLGK